MDELDRMNTAEGEDSGSGRPTDLKAYIIEADEPLQNHYQLDDLALNITDTGLDHIKILTATDSMDGSVQYYVDKTDTRFLVLHTNALAKDADQIINKMTNSDIYQFDSAWLHTGMLKFIAENFGNRQLGCAVKYEDIFKTNDSVVEPKNDLRMEIIGTISDTILSTMRENSSLDQIMGYERISLNRGTADDGVLEDLRYNGRFRLVKGDSIDEHTSLIQQVTNQYRATIKSIERERIRGKKTGSGFIVEGNAFTFEFKRNIENWNAFLPRIFNALTPFRIWGLPVDTGDNVKKVLCVDMHTGDQLDVEVGANMMRVYLSDGSCGNVVLRLYTNLQRYMDANLRCNQLEVQ